MIKVRIDLTGQTFGRLVVGSPARHTKSGKLLWDCVCQCGKQCQVPTNALRAGRTKSCGCLHRDTFRKGPGEAGFNTLLRRYRHDAKRRSHDFSLTAPEFRALTSAACHYCGAGPGRVITHHHSSVSAQGKDYAAYTYNGIDRVMNSNGYVAGNVVTCCATCNFLKQGMSKEAFLDMIFKISSYQQIKESIHE